MSTLQRTRTSRTDLACHETSSRASAKTKPRSVSSQLLPWGDHSRLRCAHSGPGIALSLAPSLALSLALNAACPVCVPDLSNRPTGKLEMVSRQFSRPPGRRGDCRRGVGSRISVCCTASEHPPLITGYLGLVMAPPWGLDHSRRPSIVAALRVCWGHARPCPPSAYPPTSSSLLA